jgi:putative transcriptional regulator
MSSDSPSTNFTHHFLIAMPSLEDEVFARSVVYLCEHSAKGALGLVINKPSDLPLSELFEKIDLSLNRADLSAQPVYHGGPVQTERGFVLHEPLGDGGEPVYASSLMIPGGLEMTTSRDVLEALSIGAGPSKVLVALGYSSWGEGQLESEIAENTWLTVEAQRQVIFDVPPEQRYDQALALLGLQTWMIAPGAGRA